MALNTFDFWVGTVLIFVLATIQALLYGWALGVDKGDAEMHQGAHLRVPRFVQFMLKYIVPVYLLTIFVAFCVKNVPEKAKAIFDSPVAWGSILFLGTVLAFVLILVHIAGRRWAAEGRFDDI